MKLNRFALTKPRGSILIFALILLILLAGIGTVFMLTAQLEGKATSNALKNSQSDETLEAGIAHARQMIYQSVSHFEPVSPDGIYNINKSAAPNYGLDWSCEQSGSNPNYSIFRAFEGYGSDLTANDTTSNSAGVSWLWSATTTDNRFTERQLAILNNADSSTRINFPGGPEHSGQSRRFRVGSTNWDDFYPPKLTPEVKTTLGRLSTTQKGEYSIWIADLDGKLYFDSKAWGITPQSKFSTTTTIENESDLAKNVIENIDFVGLTGMKVSSTAFWGASSTYSPSSIAELYYQTLGLNQTGDDYYKTRYGLERYFTVIPDAAPFGSQFIKQDPYALNVNTANYETIAAVLSRIPTVDGYDPVANLKVTENRDKAVALANRICAARPFLGRMDFEDFLAAHLNSDSTGGTVDSDLSDQTKPIGLLYVAIGKRQPLDTSGANAKLLSDAKYMGLDPTQIDINAFAANPYIIDVSLTDPTLASPNAMQRRFEFFRTHIPASIGPLSSAVLSQKAFNNILNSTSGRNPRTGQFEMSYYSEDKIAFTVGASIEYVVPDKSFAYSYQTSDMVAHTVTPKLLYNKLVKADLTALTAGQKMYVIERGNTANTTEAGELLSWKPTATSGYYEFTVDTSLDQQLFEYGVSFTPPNPLAATPVINGDTTAGLHTPLSVPPGDDVVAGTDIVDPVSGDHICNTTIHAPLRAYRHTKDAAVDAPSCIKTDGVNSDGDVAWSPRFDFRSRYFMIYVLANDMRTVGTPPQLVPGNTRRVEALYDALADKVLWRRSPISEKRALGNP